MTPSPNTTQPRSSPQTTQLPATIAFTDNQGEVQVSADVSGTNFTDYKLYAASSDPNPRLDTAPLDEQPVPPAGGRMIGDGLFTEEQVYTVQVSFLDANQNPRYVSGKVSANDARPNTMVTITLD